MCLRLLSDPDVHIRYIAFRSNVHRHTGQTACIFRSSFAKVDPGHGCVCICCSIGWTCFPANGVRSAPGVTPRISLFRIPDFLPKDPGSVRLHSPIRLSQCTTSAVRSDIRSVFRNNSIDIRPTQGEMFDRMSIRQNGIQRFSTVFELWLPPGSNRMVHDSNPAIPPQEAAYLGGLYIFCQCSWGP